MAKTATPEKNVQSRKVQLSPAELLESMSKQFGKEAVILLGKRASTPCEAISTGCLTLDVAVGVGGLPKGRVIEIFGPESSGKTTLALSVVAEAQRQGSTAAIVDAEHALDPNWARRLGVNLDNILFSQPDDGEQALEIVEAMVRSGVGVIVVDSVAALTPRAEIQGDMGDSHVGLQARLMSQALRKLTPITKKTGSTVIFINQLREKIGVMFGSPETTPGGKALKFYASLRLDVRKIGVEKEGEKSVASKVRVKVVKNKVSPPFTSAEFNISYGNTEDAVYGIDGAMCMLELGKSAGVIECHGSSYSYGAVRLGAGKSASAKLLRTTPDLYNEIRQAVLSKSQITFFQPTPEEVAAADEGEEDAQDGES